MKSSISLVVVATLCFTSLSSSYGQTIKDYYSLKVYRKEFHIEGTAYQGRSIALWQPHKEVKRAWWKYIKSKAHITNHVSHYVLKVPSEKPNEQESIFMISTIHENEGQTVIRIAYKEKNEHLENEQLAQFLLEFKTNYYTKILQSQIKRQEKSSQKLGVEMGKYVSSSNKKGVLESDEIKNQIDAFEYQIHQSDLKLDSLKGLLNTVE